ncbi:MAG: bacteriocin biosynthesis protein SagD [Myxococcaceae bacterium]|nr:bacteriocin biosynthesis protein SagD [Myxococcaceae bacterium]
MSDEVLVFRGEVAAKSAGEIIVDARQGSTVRTRVEISGGLTDATLRLAHLAGRPIEQSALISSLDRELQLEPGTAASLIEQLLAAHVLSSEVKATTRLSFSGHSEIADQLRDELANALWPAELSGLEVAVLGTLGSRGWHRELLRLRAQNCRVLTCSFEGASTWIGPLLGPSEGEAQGPCPLCLHARRVAAGAEDTTDVALCHPPSLSLVARLLHHVAEQCARGELPRGRVLHTEGATASWHPLLAQPHCSCCSGPELRPFRTLSQQAEHVARDFSRELARGEPTHEPAEAQKQAFLDPLLGPLSLEIHEASASFRELPLVLGSIRVAQRSAQGLKRREFASVMFGTGATERRRVLVAFSEGIERLAGITDEPDITGVSFRDLSSHALAPEQTVRFSESQYEAGTSVRHDGQPLDWSWVYDWTAGSAKLLVHDAVSYGRDPPSAGTRLFDDPYSSGMSAHRSVTLAVERSMYELIERDAFMLAWYLRLPLRKLELGNVMDSETRDLLGYLEAAGVRLEFRDLRVDFAVPSVLAIAEAQRDFGPWKAGGKILSACAGASFRDATRHALREILGHYTAFALVSPEGDKSIDADTGEVRPWWPAFSALLSPRDDAPLGFLGRGPPLLIGALDLPAQTPLREEFVRRGLSVFVRRLGGPEIAEAGLVAIRSIVPGLLRLTPTHASVNFGEPRIEELRQRWKAASELNPMPHPLA